MWPIAFPLENYKCKLFLFLYPLWVNSHVRSHTRHRKEEVEIRLSLLCFMCITVTKKKKMSTKHK